MIVRLFSFITAVAFTTNLYAAGAGVLPMFDDGTVLIAKERRVSKAGVAFDTISDFGGKQDKGEALARTAFREFKEETAHYSFPKITASYVANSPYVDHVHSKGSYREYLVTIHGPKPSIAQIVNNAKAAKKKLGHKAHVEKTEWMYVPAQQLLDAGLNNNPNLPGKAVPLYGPFMACLRKPGTINALQNHIATTAAKKAAAKKPVAKKAPVKKPVAKAPVKKKVVAKAPVKKKVVAKAPVKKKVVVKAPVKKPIAKKAKAKNMVLKSPGIKGLKLLKH